MGIIARYSIAVTVPYAPLMADLFEFDRILKKLPKPCRHTSWKRTWPFLDLKIPWLVSKTHAFFQRVDSHFCARDIKKYGKVSLKTWNVRWGTFPGSNSSPALLGTTLNSTEMRCLLLHTQPCNCLKESTTGFGQVARCEACNIGYTVDIVEDEKGRHGIQFVIVDGQCWNSVLQNVL